MHRLAALLALAACTLRPYDFDASATDTDVTTSTTTVPDPTTGPPADPTTSTTGSTGYATTNETDTTGHVFIVPMDGGPFGKECDLWSEDCPPGQKCMPYSSDGDTSWDRLKCVDIVPNPAGVGDPCMVFGSGVSGEDTCDLHMLCWGVDADTGVGTCFAMCIGSPDNPTCDQPGTECLIGGDGLLTLCFPVCDPLWQDCQGGHVCVPDPMNPDIFDCFEDASGEEGQVFDPCEAFNSCDPALLCANPLLAAECDPMASGCCLPFCDITVMPANCPGAGQQCLPWYDEGMAPPGLKNVGICGLPM